MAAGRDTEAWQRFVGCGAGSVLSKFVTARDGGVVVAMLLPCFCVLIFLLVLFFHKSCGSTRPSVCNSFFSRSQKNMVYSTCDSLIPNKIIGLNVLNEVSCGLSSASLIASLNNPYLPRFDCFLALTLCCRNWHLTLRTMECRLPLRHQPQRLSWKKLQTFFVNGVHP